MFEWSLGFDIPDLAEAPYYEVLRRAIAQRRAVSDARLQTMYDVRNYEYSHFFSAWGGIAHRFLACGEHHRAYTESFKRAGGEAQGIELYQQDDALFGFFVKGQSAIECLFYALYALGALIASADFSLLNPIQSEQKRNNQRQGIKVLKTVEAYRSAFPTEPLTIYLKSLSDDTDYKDWKDMRNVLAHRAATIGRDLDFSKLEQLPAVTLWAHDISLAEDTTASRYAWLCDKINEGVEETCLFARRYLPD